MANGQQLQFDDSTAIPLAPVRRPSIGFDDTGGELPTAPPAAPVARPATVRRPVPAAAAPAPAPVPVAAAPVQSQWDESTARPVLRDPVFDAVAQFANHFNKAATGAGDPQELWDNLKSEAAKIYADPQFTADPTPYLKAIVKSMGDTFDRAAQEWKNGNFSTAEGLLWRTNSVIHAVESGLPVLGPMLAQADQEMNKGDIPGGLGTATAGIVPIVTEGIGSRIGAGTGTLTNPPPSGGGFRAAVEPVRAAAVKGAGLVSNFIPPELTGILFPRVANAQRLAGRIARGLEAVAPEEAAATAAPASGVPPGTTGTYEPQARPTGPVAPPSAADVAAYEAAQRGQPTTAVTRPAEAVSAAPAAVTDDSIAQTVFGFKNAAQAQEKFGAEGWQERLANIRASLAKEEAAPPAAPAATPPPTAPAAAPAPEVLGGMYGNMPVSELEKARAKAVAEGKRPVEGHLPLSDSEREALEASIGHPPTPEEERLYRRTYKVEVSPTAPPAEAAPTPPVKTEPPATPAAAIAEKQQPVRDVVDQVIPPDENPGINKRVQSEVDFALQKGNVDAAQAALDRGRKEITPEEQLHPWERSTPMTPEEAAYWQGVAERGGARNIKEYWDALEKASRKWEVYEREHPGEDADILQRIRAEGVHEESAVQLEKERTQFAEAAGEHGTKQMVAQAVQAPEEQWTKMPNWSQRDTDRVLNYRSAADQFMRDNEKFISDKRYDIARKRMQATKASRVTQPTTK